jgi:transcriptional regulator with XRE-family HTH domain
MNRTQCKMARAALNMRAADLAEAAGLSRPTVARFEMGNSVDAASLAAMQKALEDRGAQFSAKPGRVVVAVPE